MRLTWDIFLLKKNKNNYKSVTYIVYITNTYENIKKKKEKTNSNSIKN